MLVLIASGQVHSLFCLCCEGAKIGGRALANMLSAATDLTYLNLQQQPELCDELLRAVSPHSLHQQHVHDLLTAQTPRQCNCPERQHCGV